MDVRTNDVGEVEYDAQRDEPEGECERVEIEKTKNGGFSVRKFYRPPRPKKGSDSLGYQSPDTYAFSSFAELTSFLSEAFGATAEASPTPGQPFSQDATAQA